MKMWAGGLGYREGGDSESSLSQKAIRTQGSAVISQYLCTVFKGGWFDLGIFHKSQLKALAGKVYRPHSFKSKKLSPFKALLMS